MTTKYKIPTIEELFDAGVHFGHQVKRWHPGMERYIYTVKKNIHIIDLEQTQTLLKQAAEFLYTTAKNGGKVIFVGTKKQSREIIEIESRRSGALYVTERWLGGTVTNFEIIKKNNIDKLLSLKKRKEAGELEKYTKKERLLIDKEIARLERYVGGLSSLKEIPQAIFVVDVKREKTAIQEASRSKIPVIALIDTNSNPQFIDYPIPGNDDAIKSIACIVKVLADAIEQGYVAYSQSFNTADKNIKSKDENTEKYEEPTQALEVTVSTSAHQAEEILPELTQKESEEIIAEVVEKKEDKTVKPEKSTEKKIGNTKIKKSNKKVKKEK